MKKQNSTLRLAVVGLLAALVFVSSMLQIKIPMPVGTPTRLHLGNVFCLLSGFVLGPIPGGLAAGIGSFLYDLMNPEYIADSPFTFLFKFLMAFVCGKIARFHGNTAEKVRLNFLAAAAGSLTYIILYVCKGFVQNMLLGMEVTPALIQLATKFGVSCTNAVLAVIVSVPLFLVIRKSLQRTGLLEKLEL